MTTMHGTVVTTAEAARILSATGDRIDRSALSRYVRKHDLVKPGSDRLRTLIDVEEVRAHRAQNFTREVMSGRAIAAQVPAPPSSELIPLDPKRREASARAERLELDLEERKGTLVAISDVEAALADAVSTWRTALTEQIAETAAHIVAELGAGSDQVRPTKALLKRHARLAEDRLRDAFAQVAADMRQPPSAARQRLDGLAAQAHAARIRPSQAAVTP